MLQQLNLGRQRGDRNRRGQPHRGWPTPCCASAAARLTEYVNVARAADDAGGGRDACPEQVEQESRAISQYAHTQAGMSLSVAGGADRDA